jgi:outer membrane protein assembly factor BamB
MKLWKVFLLSLGLACQSFACQPPPTQPPIVVDTTPQPLWSQARAGGGTAYGWFPQFIHNGMLITYKESQSNAIIAALDINTGQEIWTWSDLFTQHEAKTEEIHVFDNILVWRSVRRVYAINLLTGKTAWKQNIVSQVGFGTDEISGLGAKFIFHTSKPTYFSGNVLNGGIHTAIMLTPAVRTNHSAAKIFLNTPPNLLTQANLNDTLAILPYGTPEGETASFFTTYNLTQNKEIYTKTIPGDTSGAFSYSPSVHNSKIFFPAGAFVLCFDLKTGNELWRTRFGSIFFQSGLVIYNNKIYCNNNDGFSYCLDPETGKILWQTRTRGGCSLPFYLNGVVYFTSVADGRLYGLDAENGKILMNIEDPRGGIGFQDVVTGVGDKIFAATYTTLYCFKAAR